MNRASEMAAFSANMASMPADAALLDGVVVEPLLEDAGGDGVTGVGEDGGLFPGGVLQTERSTVA